MDTMRQNIFDSRNQLIGFLIENSNQVQVYDKHAKLLGYYNKSNDTTYKNNNYFGKGDQIYRLITN
jgi:hypothetical protein